MDSLKNTINKWALKVHVATNGAINFRCISCSLELQKKKSTRMDQLSHICGFIFYHCSLVWRNYFKIFFSFQMKSKRHYFSTCHKENKKRTMQPYLKALKKVQCFIKGQWMTFCFLMPLMGFYNVATLPQTLLYPQYKVIYEKAKKGLVLRQRLRGRRRSHNSLPLKKAWLKTLFTMKSRKSLLIALPENWRPTISTGKPRSIFGARK